MADDSGDGRSLLWPLMLGGIAASMVATFASGGLAFLGGAIAAACLAGSVVASLTDPEEGTRPPECLPPATVSVEVESGPSQETGQDQRWQRSVTVSRAECRRR